LGLVKVTIVKKFGTCSGVTANAATLLHVHNDIFLLNFLTIVTLARPKYEPPDDGHRSKHVGALITSIS
jgi:hypothetical protein